MKKKFEGYAILLFFVGCFCLLQAVIGIFMLDLSYILEMLGFAALFFVLMLICMDFWSK